MGRPTYRQSFSQSRVCGRAGYSLLQPSLAPAGSPCTQPALNRFCALVTGHNNFFQHRTFTENTDNFSQKNFAVHPHGPHHLTVRKRKSPESKRRMGHTQHHHFRQELDAISTKNTCGVLGAPPLWAIETPVLSENKRGV